ncbi:M48 family metallopeptidase [Imbroritus primus]|uniref:M48 family metallopeptidase n=1 Tax=Imbroritus primus TaxID=3058603 RepID=A0ACD3SU31_9BURK|nr:M48 family metallopeptidase [Burkholderiaceae bacterium PBA]
MTVKERTVCYGDEVINFEVVLRPARKTLGIEVHPDGSVLVLSPVGCDEATIYEKVQLRASWISRQLAMFSRFERHTAPRQYLSGESHRYLGRQYRLRVLADEAGVRKEQVKLTRGEMLVIAPGKLPPLRVKELLRRWYLGRAREIYDAVLTQVFDTFERQGYEKPRLSVREMRSRWGSLSPSGQMTLNSRLVQAPRPCIEYVIVHELCHLAHRDHSQEFYLLLGQVMSDWQARKQRLEEALL